MAPPKITLKHVAARAGVHPTTVSMALRNHPEIPAHTRQRLKELAAEMGYRPDPMLAALNAYRIAGYRKSFQGVVAWIDAVPARVEPRRLGGFEDYWKAIASRCEALGFTLEEFRLRTPGMSGLRLSRILRERGIEGVLIAPLHAGRGHLRLQWDWFSAVSVSHSLTAPGLHTVVPAQYSGMTDLLRRLKRLGYQRPGLVLGTNEHERTDHQRLAAYLSGIRNFPAAPPAPFLHRGDQAGRFREWLARERPDVVIGQSGTAYRWMTEAGLSVPEEIGFAGVAVARTSSLSGQVEDLDLLGRSAVDWLEAMVRRGERGIPPKPLRLLIPNDWQEGTTLRQPSAHFVRRGPKARPRKVAANH